MKPFIFLMAMTILGIFSLGFQYDMDRYEETRYALIDLAAESAAIANYELTPSRLPLTPEEPPSSPTDEPSLSPAREEPRISPAREEPRDSSIEKILSEYLRANAPEALSRPGTTADISMSLKRQPHGMKVSIDVASDDFFRSPMLSLNELHVSNVPDAGNSQ